MAKSERRGTQSATCPKYVVTHASGLRTWYAVSNVKRAIQLYIERLGTRSSKTPETRYAVQRAEEDAARGPRQPLATFQLCALDVTQDSAAFVAKERLEASKTVKLLR